MNNERYNQIIDEVYEKWIYESCNGRIYPNINEKEQFINRIKTEPKFSERWGLKIEESELNEKERIILAGYDYQNRGGIGWNVLKEKVDMDNYIPRKLITITYKDEKIEIYE